MIINNFKLKRAGFTLMELMLIVILFGILLTVSIGRYINFQKRAKTSEAKANLGSIRICQEAYHIGSENYLSCPMHPSSVPQGTSVLWESAQLPNEWKKLGFEPCGKVRYSYKVDTSDDGQSFIALAYGDLNGDSVFSTFSINENGGEIQENSPLE